MTGLPKDPMLLLSVVNTKLRDYYSTLEVLCEDMGADQDELMDKLRGIGYEYDEARKQFINIKKKRVPRLSRKAVR